MSKGFKISTIFSLLLAISLSGLYYAKAYYWGPHAKGGLFFIKKGSSLNSISAKLEEEGHIRNAESFKLLVILQKAESSLQSGEYHIRHQMNAEEILKLLSSGEVVQRKLTIPEGFNFRKIAARLARHKIGKKEEILKLFEDPDLLKMLPFEAVNLEGYLYPSTYAFHSQMKAREFLEVMIRNFIHHYDEELIKKTQAKGWTIPQVVTLASIIEKETAASEERALISGVFHNRLKINMLLQTDPTVIYGIKNFNGNITRKDLRTDHPHNTYVRKGLPPTPIASPGKASFLAALEPAETEYLYFVSRGNGRHAFSKNLAEHNRAVRKYQLKK